jgi:hypothetical protein
MNPNGRPAVVMDPVEFLRGMVRGVGSQKEVAKLLGVSAQYVCDVLAGRREVSEKLGRALGYQRVVSFLPLPEGFDERLVDKLDKAGTK